MISFHPLFLYLLSYLILHHSASFAFLHPQANCSTCLPNPIATTYPINVTGVINATTSVLLVPLPYARSLLPTRHANSILTHAYTRFNIPPDVYPLVVESSIDHDIRYSNFPAVADFSAFRATFPFIDLLGDGYSSFRYTGFIYLPPNNPVAIKGSEDYGYTVLPGYFDPHDAPYRFASRKRKDTLSAVYTITNSTNRARLSGSTKFHPSPSFGHIPLSFYKNITNQIMFGNKTSVCDHQTSLWNTSVTTGDYEPKPVLGDVMLSPPLVPEREIWRGVQGIRAQRAFIELNYLNCEDFKGWNGTGSGDSG
ncbi:MAG: hypothetical protein Q9182_001827 [Xanthomendoza sp. 2 TL-2023]